MENYTRIKSFVLTMYADTGQFTHLYFFLSLFLYILVIVVNAALIVIIYRNRNLHEPMYLFLCCLFTNEIYGSTSLMPCLMVHILSKTHDISLFFCFIQIFNIHSYVAVEFGTLTIMAYDRYVCICKPLHYNVIITVRKVQTVIVVIWVVSFVEVLVLLTFTFNLKFCGNLINKVHCDNNLVLDLSCSSDRTMSYIYDIVFGLTFTVAAPVTFIMISYIQILVVCVRGSKQTRMKAFDTCAPHLLSLISFVFACFYNLISQRYDMKFVPFELRVILSMYGLIIQPLLNPLIYGLKLSKIRLAVKASLITIKKT